MFKKRKPDRDPYEAKGKWVIGTQAGADSNVEAFSNDIARDYGFEVRFNTALNQLEFLVPEEYHHPTLKLSWLIGTMYNLCVDVGFFESRQSDDTWRLVTPKTATPSPLAGHSHAEIMAVLEEMGCEENPDIHNN